MALAVIVDACMTGKTGEGLLSAQLGGVSVLKRVLERCARMPGIGALVCVMSNDPAMDSAAADAGQCDALVIRGDAADALGLCAQGASETGAEIVIRVAAHQPFFDPALGARVLQLLREAEADYSCTDLPASWPEGLDCEVFSARLLHWADALADHPEHRARVTSWMRANSDLKKACLTGPGGDFAHMRWALGWPEDLAFAQAVFEQMGERAACASASEIASFCLRRPDVAALNARRNNSVRLKAKLRADVETAPMSLAVVA
jgi:spore coat polysaccharide biosynthesis protein SpsF (cytidylyltransferase family)